VLLPVIVVGELLFGAEIGARRESSLQSVREMVSKVEVLGCTTETAFHYGRIKAALRRAGRPIPENDLWIAAIAMQHGITLVSRDVHFTEIDGLALECW
jgi:tRNA(fMet)-specific endonuclease VapC